MRTLLYQRHLDLGAKMINFSGWEMPLQYRGIVHEHEAVRNQVGIFDVSHMGRIQIHGLEAESFLDYVSTNQIRERPSRSATYTVFCNPLGYCIEDTLVYKENEQNFFCVTNAANRMKVFNHLQSHSPDFHVSVTHRFDDEGILALQGPQAASLLGEIFPPATSLTHMHFDTFPFQKQMIIISRTGYTGSDGFEIFLPNQALTSLWDMLLKHGKKYQLEPCGLGSRDTLRLEMGYALYGHELSESIAPIESVAAWSVKEQKEPFLGREALKNLMKSSSLRRQFGVILQEKCIAREKYPVFLKNEFIGRVTSGTYSPSLKKGIAIIMVNVPLERGDEVFIEIREKKIAAEITKLPFFQPFS